MFEARGSHAEAARWYRLAADQGQAFAQFKLGVAYEGGRGVGQDDVAAYFWCNLAAAQLTDEDLDLAVAGEDLPPAFKKMDVGVQRMLAVGEDRYLAVVKRDGVAQRMTPDQIAEAQRRAQEWTPTPEP